MVFSRQLIQSSFVLALIFSTALSSGVIAVPLGEEFESISTKMGKLEISDSSGDDMEEAQHHSPKPMKKIKIEAMRVVEPSPFEGLSRGPIIGVVDRLAFEEFLNNTSPKESLKDDWFINLLKNEDPNKYILESTPKDFREYLKTTLEKYLQATEAKDTQQITNVIREVSNLIPIVRTGGQDLETHRRTLKKHLYNFYSKDAFKIWNNLLTQGDPQNLNFFKECFEDKCEKLNPNESFYNQVSKIQKKAPFLTNFSWAPDKKISTQQFRKAINLFDVRSLHLNFAPEAIIAGIEAIKSNSELKKLSLTVNKISTQGILCLSEALKSNSNLEELVLKNNSIGDEGIFYLAETLRHNRSLEKLNLSKNKFSEMGISYLSEALKQNKDLKVLNLLGNTFPSEALQQLKASRPDLKIKYNN